MRRIANFLVDDEPLAKGGMGQIFKGKDEYGNTIAVKEILPEFANDWGIINRIEKEVEFLVKVDHPSIVKLHAAFKDPSTDCYYIVMEYVEGLNIEQYIMRNGAIPPDKAVDLMVKILDAMQCVHNAHIVHRDIKPSNIMIRDNGTICLLDFGVAKDLDSKAGGTIVGTVIGTNGYMSPEQADGYAIDFRSDIYSLGCVFYFILTGHHAFNTLASDFETKDAILSNDFPKLSKYKPGLPNELQKILDKATEKNMTRRYSSCYAFMSDMRNGTHVSNAGHGAIPIKISIGREMCDIIMSDAERKISRHHADIELKEQTGGQYYVLTDCSSNGTLVDGRRLQGTSISIKADGPFPQVYLAGTAEGKISWKQVRDEINKKRESIYSAMEFEAPSATDVKTPPKKISPSKEMPELPQENEEAEETTKSAMTQLLSAYALIAVGLFNVYVGIVGTTWAWKAAFSKKEYTDGTKSYTYKKSHRIIAIVGGILGLLIVIAGFVVKFSHRL